MLIFLYGKDTFRSRKHLKKFIENFQEKRDSSGLNVVKINCEKTKEFNNIWNEVLSTPFLAEKKMIILEYFFSANLLKLYEMFIHKIKEGFFSSSNSNIIVFWDDIEKAKNKSAEKLFKILAEEKYSQKFDLLNEKEIIKFLISEAKNDEINLQIDAANYIAQNSYDLWQASSILEQLSNLCEDKNISQEQCVKFLPKKYNDNIFNLVDAVISKDLKSAFEMIREQYKKGEDSQFVFAMLLRQFRILTEIKDLIAREGQKSSNEVAERLKIHPYVAKKTLGIVNRYSLSQLKETYEVLLDFDLKTKTGQSGQDLLLDFLALKLTA